MPSNDAGSIADQLAAEVRRLLQSADERAKQVMEKAEAEVARIRAEAEKEGHRRIEAARTALDDLEGRLGTVPPGAEAAADEEAAVPDPVPESEPVADEEPEAAADEIPQAVADAPEPPAASPARSGDESAARLVAMKMALDGTSRDDVRAKLASDYSVADLDGLLDDVFAKAGK